MAAGAVLFVLSAGWGGSPAGVDASFHASGPVLVSVPLRPGGSAVGRDPSLSATGRFVAFESDSPDLVPHDTNGAGDVFLRDLATRRTVRVSSGFHGEPATLGAYEPAISADGSRVAFVSRSTNLVPGVAPAFADVFVRDRWARTTVLASVARGGGPGGGSSSGPALSAHGRFVAFASRAPDLVPHDDNGRTDVFVRDLLRGSTSLVSTTRDGRRSGDGYSFGASISADGRFVAFTSSADDLVPGDTNHAYDVFLRDRRRAVTERVSVGEGGAQADGSSLQASVSADGRHVAFVSSASDLVAHDDNGVSDVFVRDRVAAVTLRVSVGVGGEADEPSQVSRHAVTGDGRFVAFTSPAHHLVHAGVASATEAFVRDVVDGSTRLVSVGSDGARSNGGSSNAQVSQDGSAVVFESTATTLTRDVVVFPFGNPGVYLAAVRGP